VCLLDVTLPTTLESECCESKRQTRPKWDESLSGGLIHILNLSSFRHFYSLKRIPKFALPHSRSPTNRDNQVSSHAVNEHIGMKIPQRLLSNDDTITYTTSETLTHMPVSNLPCFWYTGTVWVSLYVPLPKSPFLLKKGNLRVVHVDYNRVKNSKCLRNFGTFSNIFLFHFVNIHMLGHHIWWKRRITCPTMKWRSPYCHSLMGSERPDILRIGTYTNDFYDKNTNNFSNFSVDYTYIIRL
jgi:hypothetical protein